MDANESTENQTHAETETPKISPELLKVKMNALSKATARKKEIGLIKKAEKMKKDEDLDLKISQAKELLKQKVVIPEPEVVKKRVKKVIEKVIEEESSSDEEIIERIIIKKKPHKQQDNDEDQMIMQSNKELLQKKLKDEQRKKLMADLFSY